jgi:sporulation protein YpjB
VKGGTSLKAKWLMLLFCVFFLMPVIVNGEQLTPISKLDDISDEALQMVKFQRYDDAKKLLDYFSDQFTTITEKERPLTTDEVRIVTVSRDEAMEAAVSSNMNYQERISRLTKFRLVIDAVTTKQRPLWTEMEDKVLTAFNQAKDAARNGDRSGFNTSFNSFLSLYNMIYPSMKIDVPVENIQKLDTKINFIDEYRSEFAADTKKMAELDGLEADLKKLFADMDKDQSDPSLWWVIISTGSIIIMTLSYVGWRKYQADHTVKKDRSHEYKD